MRETTPVRTLGGEGVHEHRGLIANLHGKHVYLVDYAVHLHVEGIDNLDYISVAGDFVPLLHANADHEAAPEGQRRRWIPAGTWAASREILAVTSWLSSRASSKRVRRGKEGLQVLSRLSQGGLSGLDGLGLGLHVDGLRLL